MSKNVTAMLRLSYGEMLLIETILSMVLDGGARETPRSKSVKHVRNKIQAALDQAERDGLIDMKALSREMRLVGTKDD